MRLKFDDLRIYMNRNIAPGGLIAVCAVIVAAGCFNADVYEARRNVVKSDLAAIHDAIELYRMDMCDPPEKLEYLIVAPPNVVLGNWSGPYLRGGLPKDPWGNDYQYIRQGISEKWYDLYSFGADGHKGGEGENKDLTMQEQLSESLRNLKPSIK